ncbi:EcsC family protein [Corynebacterium mendelii]
MTAYERAQWDSIQEWKDRRWKQAADFAAGKAKEAVAAAVPQPVKHAAAAIQEIEELDKFNKIVNKAAIGFITTLEDAGRATASQKKVVRRLHKKTGVELETLSDIREKLSLEQLVSNEPKTQLGLGHKGVAGVVGAAAGAATSAGFALAAAGNAVPVVGAVPGVSVVLAALSADLSLLIANSSSAVTKIAYNYGYDLSLPEEQMFATAVITGTTAGEKIAYEAAMHRLMLDLARKKKWDQLNKHIFAKLIKSLFKAMGQNLAKHQLVKAIPVANVAVNAGLDMWTLHSATERARYYYRERFLIERYGVRDGREDIEEADIIATADELLDAIKNDTTNSLKDAAAAPRATTGQPSSDTPPESSTQTNAPSGAEIDGTAS